MAARKTSAAKSAPAAPAANPNPPINSALLLSINAATLAGGFMYANEFEATPLATLGYVVLNAEIRNEQGQIGAMTTDSGKALAISLGAGSAPPAAPPAFAAPQPPVTQPATGGPKFAILKGITVPEKTTRVRGREERYPFGAMEVGDGFHVPATDDVPDPAKTLQSTVSSANARFAIEERDANGNVIMENKTVSEAVRDPQGDVVRDSNGKLVRHTVTKTGPKLSYPRRFAVFPTDANYRDAAGNVLGVGAIVTRTK